MAGTSGCYFPQQPCQLHLAPLQVWTVDVTASFLSRGLWVSPHSPESQVPTFKCHLLQWQGMGSGFDLPALPYKSPCLPVPWERNKGAEP